MVRNRARPSPRRQHPGCDAGDRLAEQLHLGLALRLVPCQPGARLSPVECRTTLSTTERLSDSIAHDFV